MLDPEIAREQAGNVRILRKCDATTRSCASAIALAENMFLQKMQCFHHINHITSKPYHDKHIDSNRISNRFAQYNENVEAGCRGCATLDWNHQQPHRIPIAKPASKEHNRHVYITKFMLNVLQLLSSSQYLPASAVRTRPGSICRNQGEIQRFHLTDQCRMSYSITTGFSLVEQCMSCLMSLL